MNTGFFTFPILKTERLDLRSVVSRDKDQIFKIRSDQKVNQYIDRTPASDIKEAELHILEIEQLYRDDQGINWVLNKHNNSLFMGSICLWKYDAIKESVEIGYYILPEHQRQGYMAEAMEACISFAFNKMEAKVLTADVHKNNKPSISLLEKFSFLLERPCDWNPDHQHYILRKRP